MKTVTPTELRKHLSRHLRFVRSGEEVVIVSRGVPVARILPIPESISDQERRLVAAGALKLPVKPVKNRKKFWDDFFAMPGPNLSREEALRAILEEREESR
ncbi:MAG: type II toxin-antitoxin system prevent-host-death family antitoxin [Candidatus Korobacteraceae bacterium]|jgi:prevent-host-death family protein